MKLEPVGGIFWRLDSSGNLTAYDTAGTVLGQFVGGTFHTVNTRADTSITGSGTTSATFVSTGDGVSITPLVGKVALFMTGSVRSTVASDQAEIGIYRNTTGIPGEGAGVGGDASIIESNPFQLPGGVLYVRVPLVAVDISVVAGTQYFYYTTYRRASGTGTIVLDGGGNQLFAMET